MIKDGLCEVCKEEKVKYRCPKCQIIYCSLGCYKSHKDACEQTEKEGAQRQETVETEPGFVEEFLLGDDESEDKVSAEQLKALEDSLELKSMLNNPHLRQIITDLARSDIESVNKKLEAALREPIFTEFSDKCIEVIDDDGSIDT